VAAGVRSPGIVGGRLAEARRLADEAQGTYRALDARRGLASAQSRFRAEGLPSGPRGERARLRRGLESLTQAEMPCRGSSSLSTDKDRELRLVPGWCRDGSRPCGALAEGDLPLQLLLSAEGRQRQQKKQALS
jgi:hypothetical protein